MSVIGGIKHGAGAVLGVVNTPFTVVNAAQRTSLDTVPNMGVIGDRWNWRDAYRKQNSKERFGDGLGAAMAMAVPTGTLARYAVKSFKAGRPVETIGISSLPHTAYKVGAGAIAAGALGYMGYKAFGRIQAIGQDDGHYGAAAASAGIGLSFVAGYKLGNHIHFGGKLGVFNPIVAPLTGGAAAVAGGVIGYTAGSHLKNGPGHIKEDYKSTFKPATALPGTAADFTRAAAIDLWDVGPPSQGVSFRYTWKGDQAYATNYSPVERGGAIAGDLAGAAILGGGALAVTRGMLARGATQTHFGTFAATTGKLNAGYWASQMIEGLPTYIRSHGVSDRAVNGAMVGVAAAVGIGALGIEARDFKRGDNVSKGIIAGFGAAGIAAAIAVRNGNFIKAMRPESQAASAALTGAVLIGVLSSARLPVQQMVSNARESWRLHKADTTTAAGVAGVGALGGAAIGLSVAGKFSGNLRGGKAGLVLGGGTLLGAAIGAGMGIGAAPNVASLGKAGIAAGAGAALLGGGVFALGSHSPKAGLMAAAVGGLVGVVASPLLGGQKATAPAGGAATSPAPVPTR